MITEDECDLNAPIKVAREVLPKRLILKKHEDIRFQKFLTRFRRIKDQKAHFALQNDLIDHS